MAKKYRWGWFLAIILCTLTCGCYQAFICYAIGLFLIDCILDVLLSERKYREILVKGIKYIGIVVASLLLYYLILIVIINIKEISLTSYQGISSVGLFNLKSFLLRIPMAYKIFIQQMITTPYNTEFYQEVQLLFFAIAFGLMIYLVIEKKLYQEPWRMGFFIIEISLIPLALNFIIVLATDANIHAVMIYSFVLEFVFALKLIEIAIQRISIKRKSKRFTVFFISTATAAILVWNNFCTSNVAYLRLQICYENTFALANQIVARIKQLEGYHSKLSVSIIGEAD